MDGITILSSFQASTGYNISIGWALVIWVVVIIISAVACEIWFEFGGFGVILGLLAGLLLLSVIIRPTNYETRYKVIIDDSVSMTEFYEKYEVVEQEGLIFTVKERC